MKTVILILLMTAIDSYGDKVVIRGLLQSG